MKEMWEKCQEELKQYVVECEKKVYMFLFELYYCIFYYEMIRVFEFGFGKFDQWNDEMEEKEKIWLVMFYGKLLVKYFIYDEWGNGFFINFEYVKDVLLIYDLVLFYFCIFCIYLVIIYDSYEWFSMYEKYFVFREEEWLFLYSYLVFSEFLYQCIV